MALKIDRREALLDRIASRAAKLLKESPNPQQEMEWAEHRLWQESLFSPHRVDRSSPSKWVQEVLAQNLDVREDSIPWVLERDSHPERAETFESLILSLIPSESGL